MLKPVFACLLLAAPATVAAAQSSAPAQIEAARTVAPDPSRATGEWTVAGGATGCILHASSRQGTVVSILAGPGQDSLLFLIQNRQWSSLRDGEKHRVAVGLDESREFEFDAVAKTELDSDGPGLLFAVRPGQADDANFITRLAAANGIRIGSDGRRLDSLPVADGQTAMSALAQCMGQMWAAAGGAQGEEEGEPEFPVAAATPI